MLRKRKTVGCIEAALVGHDVRSQKAWQSWLKCFHVLSQLRWIPHQPASVGMAVPPCHALLLLQPAFSSKGLSSIFGMASVIFVVSRLTIWPSKIEERPTFCSSRSRLQNSSIEYNVTRKKCQTCRIVMILYLWLQGLQNLTAHEAAGLNLLPNLAFSLPTFLKAAWTIWSWEPCARNFWHLFDVLRENDDPHSRWPSFKDLGGEKYRSLSRWMIDCETSWGVERSCPKEFSQKRLANPVYSEIHWHNRYMRTLGSHLNCALFVCMGQTSRRLWSSWDRKRDLGPGQPEWLWPCRKNPLLAEM